MNRKQAMAEARRRWGKDAIIREDRSALPKAERLKLPKGDTRRFSVRCSVGELSRLPVFGGGFHVHGWADTWEEAFVAADATAERYRRPSAPPAGERGGE